jgi:PTS system maltose and glucose-specific IIC component
MYIGVGLIMFALYFVVFRFLILQFNMKTPGREDDQRETRLYSKQEYQAKGKTTDWANQSSLVWRRQNIDVVDNCYTRLRVTVKTSPSSTSRAQGDRRERDYQTR